MNVRRLLIPMIGALLLLAVACEEVTVEAPSSTNTPAPAATQGPTATPVPTDAPAPTEAPLEAVTAASLWVYLVNEYEYLTPYADSSFDMEEFELTLIVDGVEHCNPTRMYGDEGRYEMSCGLQEVPHSTIDSVSAQTPH